MYIHIHINTYIYNATMPICLVHICIILRYMHNLRMCKCNLHFTYTCINLPLHHLSSHSHLFAKHILFEFHKNKCHNVQGGVTLIYTYKCLKYLCVIYLAVVFYFTYYNIFDRFP